MCSVIRDCTKNSETFFTCEMVFGETSDDALSLLMVTPL